MLTRRRILWGAATIPSAMGADSLLPTNVLRALAQMASRPGSLRDIEYIVLLMQENRSFDHYFGTMAGVRGFEDVNALKRAGGRSVFCRPDTFNPDGYLFPFHLDTRKSSAQKIPSTSHAWHVQHQAGNGGRMDQWLLVQRHADGAHGRYCISYFTREDIPFQFALAEGFTLCDGYHSLAMGPTWPNRMSWIIDTVDPDGSHGGPIISNRAPDPSYTWNTYSERLEEAGNSWKVYQQENNYGCKFLETFNIFREARKNSHLYTKGMLPGPEVQFEYDAMNDKLPAVLRFIPTSFQSEHPDYMPAEGAAFIANKIDVIAANRDVWEKTLNILNYEENDGIFDHVAPPVPPAGTSHELIGSLPISAGFRVPCILLSPWAAGGWVSNEAFDHTSVLQLLERFTGMRVPNISEWIRQSIGDLTSALRLRQSKDSLPNLPDSSGPLRLWRHTKRADYPSRSFRPRTRSRRNRKRRSPSEFRMAFQLQARIVPL
jgi:phospholipase C